LLSRPATEPRARGGRDLFHLHTAGGSEHGTELCGHSRAYLDNFNGRFGPLPQPGMKIAQLPDGTVAGYAAPGLLLVSAHQWTAQPNARLLANLAAQQWWGTG